MLLRRSLLCLLATIAVVASGAALSASAAASQDVFYFQQTGLVSPNSNVGLLSVTIESSSPVTSLTVSLYQSSTHVLDLPMSDFAVPADDGDGQWGTWTLTSPLTTSDLSIGQYDVYASAADAGGGSVTGELVGQLDFENAIQFTFAADRTAIDQDHQDVTFSGTATFLPPPGGGPVIPFANKQIELGEAPYGTHNQYVTTESDGSYTVTVQAADQGIYQILYNGDAQTNFSYSSPITVTVNTSSVQISASLAAADVMPGDPDSVSGTVTYTDGGVTKPLAGVTVGLYLGYYASYQTPATTTVTDASGNYTMPVPTQQGDTWVVATAPTTYLLTGQSAALPVAVAEPNAITGFSAKLSRFGVVSFSACLIANSGRVVIAYAPKASGPWSPLRTSSAFTGTTCGQGGHAIAGHALARLAAAYYRLEYPATPDWQDAVSVSAYLWKHLTKFTAFTVIPRSVPRNGTVTVSGQLWTRSKAGKWHPYAHRRVLVIFRYQGTWYRYRHEPTTDSSGRFSKSFKVYVSAPFTVVYEGDSTHFASGSKEIKVTASGASPAVRMTSPPGLVPVRGLSAVLLTPLAN